MTSRATSFRGLKHPLTLASIGLLLLNDHVLKTTAPSPLTGKLSDLAGLFFFPFLLAAVLSLPFDRLRVPPRRTAALAFGLTSLWFTLIKTWPWANALTVAALTRLLGPSVKIVLDPTDLLALVVLWPAWRLWVHLERPSPLKPPGKAAYLALGVASLATLATSCDESSVERVMVFEQSVYADLGHDSVARSDNGGQTWTRIRDFEDMPGQILQQLDRRVQLPITVCDPENTQTCYRVTGTEQVQGSQDGGQTWKVVWGVPWGRREFIERFSATQICGRKSDLAPRDLVLLLQEEGVWLFAAMGNEGVLVRTPQGAWRRYGVLAASPTPYRSGDPGVLFKLLFLENGLFLMTALLAWWAFCILGWVTVLSKAQLPPDRSIKWAIAPAAWWVFLLLVNCLLFFVNKFIELDTLRMLFSAALTVLLAFIGPVLTWRRVASVSPWPEATRAAARACWQGAMGIFPLAWLAFPLWTLGVIPLYVIALALSILVGVVSLVWNIRRVRRMSLAAARPAEGMISR
jgi:hypothetical protein